jgi:outer membrane protein TolC
VRNTIPVGGRVPGILLTRVGHDQSKLEFERRLHELVFAVEEAYWGLYGAYWELYSRENALKQVHAAWKVAKARFDAGGIGIEDLAMIEEQYHFFRSQRLEALGRGVAGRPGVLEAERRLRYVVGLPAEDGTRLVPSDYPKTVPADLDWSGAYAEARTHRPELRQVQQDIKAVELSMLKAKDLLLPDLRFFSRYDVNGLGTNVGSGLNRLNSHEWETGIQMQVPLGFREGNAEVMRVKYQLAQRYAFLRDQESKLLFSLQRSYRDVVQLREEMRIRKSQREAAATQLKARLEKFRAGGDPKRPEASIDLLLRSQRNWADAVRDEYIAICNYNVALADFKLQKGTILEFNNVHIAEGPVPAAVASTRASQFLRGWHQRHTPQLLPGELDDAATLPETPRRTGPAPVRFLPPQ